MKHAEIKQCSRILVSGHASTAWNDRVGPLVATQAELESVLNNYLKEPDRIAISGRDCLIFDEEIVAGTSIQRDGSIMINTFFGRISLNPWLNDHDRLTTFMIDQARGRGNSKLVRSVKSEGINLSLSPDQRDMQSLPEFPVLIERRTIMSCSFKLTYWENGQVLVKQLTGNNGVGQEFIVDVDKPESTYVRVVPRSLSHVHIAYLIAIVDKFYANARTTDDLTDREPDVIIGHKSWGDD